MWTWILYYRDQLKAAYWLIPTLMGLGAFILSFVTVAVDRSMQGRLQWWIFAAGPEGARAVLSTIAGSMISVTALVFSITIVALTLASSQFGPRLLRNFIRDRQNQCVAGTFIATFIYCLMILRTVSGRGSEEFVPELSVTIGIVLALASLIVLIYFIHHLAVSIQVTHLIRAVTAEMSQTIDNLFPEDLGEEEEDGNEDFVPSGECQVVDSRGSGYLVAVNGEQLLSGTIADNLVVELVCQPGQFVMTGNTLANVWGETPLEKAGESKIRNAFVLASQRDAFQDLRFTIDQLVELAVRALSPGINDPFTAINCIDHLGECLCALARRRFPSRFRRDKDQQLRVIAYPVSFGDMLDASFDKIRHYGRSSPEILTRILESLYALVGAARRPSDKASLVRHSEMIRTIAAELPGEVNCAKLTELCDAVVKKAG